MQPLGPDVPAWNAATWGSVNAVFETTGGDVWFATSRGLVRLRGNRFTALGVEQGLPSEPVATLAEDASGRLWVATTVSLLALEPQDIEDVTAGRRRTLASVVLDETDGLAGMPGRGRPLAPPARASDGSLWFVTGRGLTGVDPDMISTRPSWSEGAVRIEGGVVGDRRFEPRTNVALPPNPERLRIDFTALGVGSPARTRFRYRLDGLETQWTEAGTTREATYTNLRPGTYTFQVVAASEKEPGSELSSAWTFRVEPAFYQTPLFAVCVALGVGFGVLGAWRLRLRQIRRGFAQVMAERTRVSREIHDTLLQSLAGVALQIGDATADIDHSPDSARLHLLRIRKQVEQYAAEAARTIRDLRSPLLDNRGLADGLGQMVIQVTEGTPTRATVRALGTVRPIPDASQHHLLRIAQEAVTNATRHGRASSVDVELTFHDDRLVLRIVDDGIGFEGAGSTDGPSTHLGLEMMRERTEQLGGRLDVTSRPGIGTRIEASIPLDHTRRLAS
jgi:signal transduction histidine kinase